MLLGKSACIDSTTGWQHVNSHELATNKNTEAASIHKDNLTFALSLSLVNFHSYRS